MTCDNRDTCWLFAVETILYDCDFGDDGTYDSCGFSGIDGLTGPTADNSFYWVYSSEGHVYLYGYIDYDGDILIG